MENPIKMDDLVVPLFLETPTCLWIFFYLHFKIGTNVIGSHPGERLRAQNHLVGGSFSSAGDACFLVLSFLQEASSWESKGTPLLTTIVP